MRAALTILFLLWSLPAWAACEGRDLLQSLNPAWQETLADRVAAQPYPRGILWRAERDGQVIHLVGTMHFHDARHDATLAQARPWIDAAETVFLELGSGDEARLQAEITENPALAFIIEGPTLPDLMGPADWDLMRKAMQERGVPGFLAAKMKPWMALMTLSLTKCVMESVNAGLKGLDGQIIDYAEAIGKPARALEDYDTALQLFEDYGEAEMLTFLSLFQRLENYDPDDQHATLVEAYFRQDVRAIWEFGVMQSLAQPQGMRREEILAEYARLEEALINARNRAWMGRILPAAEKGPVFVAAGALHLPGEAGLLRLLEGEGFQITRIAGQ